VYGCVRHRDRDKDRDTLQIEVPKGDINQWKIGKKLRNTATPSTSIPELKNKLNNFYNFFSVQTRSISARIHCKTLRGPRPFQRERERERRRVARIIIGRTAVSSGSRLSLGNWLGGYFVHVPSTCENKGDDWNLITWLNLSQNLVHIPTLTQQIFLLCPYYFSHLQIRLN
jgi:hypothetical protein